MHRGYIRLWRKSQESIVFQNEGLWKVWTWCLMQAAWKPKDIDFETGTDIIRIKIEPGQFIFGRQSAASKLRMKQSTVRNRMEKLKKLGKLDINSDSRFSLITIKNWDSYQPNEIEEGQQKGQEKDSRRTVEGQQKDTTKKEQRKYKEGTKKLSPLPPFIDSDIWTQFVEHRKTLKPKMTQNAAELIIAKLGRFHEKGLDPNEALKLSIENGWKGVFEPKGRNGTGRTVEERQAQACAEWLREEGVE